MQYHVLFPAMPMTLMFRIVLSCLCLILLLGDNGSLYFWDWKTGYNFHKIQTTVQPGSLDSEAGIFMTEFDQSGCRLITAEADKTIKIYKEDETAVSLITFYL